MGLEALPSKRSASVLLPDVGVLALVPDCWSSRWMVRHHLMARLGRYFHVLWVNPAVPWRDALKGKSQPSPDASDLPYPGFSTYTPELWLPEFYWPRWLANLSLQKRLKNACALLRERGCLKIVLYLWRPEFEPTLPMIPSDMICYHLEDEYSFSRMEKPIDPIEARLLAEVDQVFILSPALFAKKGRLNTNTLYLPGGVDFRAYSEPLPEPADLATIPHPRIGYVGSLKWQIDWSLLVYLAQQHPEWSFVLVGPRSPHPEIDAALATLADCKNVHFLGGKPSSEMIAYPQHFDVCIMPYGANGYTKYIYPLKLHEYLASGRPLVGTPIDSLAPLSDVVSLPESAQQWSRDITQALTPSENTPEERRRRQDFARLHDWDALVLRIAETIATHLDPRYAQILAQHFQVAPAESQAVTS
jgi:glycosyltransferase involved in cell wall biosynthesis